MTATVAIGVAHEIPNLVVDHSAAATIWKHLTFPLPLICPDIIAAAM